MHQAKTRIQVKTSDAPYMYVVKLRVFCEGATNMACSCMHPAYSMCDGYNVTDGWLIDHQSKTKHQGRTGGLWVISSCLLCLSDYLYLPAYSVQCLAGRRQRTVQEREEEAEWGKKRQRQGGWRRRSTSPILGSPSAGFAISTRTASTSSKCSIRPISIGVSWIDIKYADITLY